MISLNSWKIQIFFLILYITDNNVFAYKLFERFKNTERFKALKVIGCVGDVNIRDEDFNSKLICHYRLYDDFIEPLREILSLRLENRMPIGMSMVRMLKFRRMTASQINSYFDSVLQNDYNKFN